MISREKQAISVGKQGAERAQQNDAIKIRGLANVLEVACGSSFNLVSLS